MTFESEGLLIVATVYSFEFAQSYFRPTDEMRLIRPVLNSLSLEFYYISPCV